VSKITREEIIKWETRCNQSIGDYETEVHFWGLSTGTHELVRAYRFLDLAVRCRREKIIQDYC